MILKDFSNDSVLTGDGYTFPYLNWSLIEAIDMIGDGTESFWHEYFLPNTENMKYCFNAEGD